LAAKGLKDIALDVTNRFYKHVRMRIEGYKEGLENNDIDLNHEMIIDCNGRGDSVDLLTEKILKLRPQALIAGNDLRAIMLMRNLRELKMDIPGDIKIIGFDNMEFAPFVAPSLSSVDLQNEKLAEAAFEMIFQFIKKGAFPKNITVKPELIIRESA
jgi:DNA-binding LacI/PurR family transcriptional regulator